MHRKRRYLVYTILALIDVALIVCSYLLACLIYLGTVSGLGGLDAISYPPGSGNAIYVVVVYAVLLAVAYALSSVYGYTYIGKIRGSVLRILAVNTAGIVVVTGLLYLLHLDDVSRATLFVFYVVSSVAVCAKTWISFRVFLMARKNKHKFQKTLVVGEGPLARQYIEAVEHSSSRFEQIVGYITAERIVREGHASGWKIGNVGRLGFISDLEDILRSSDVEKVVIALEPAEYSYVGMVMAAADTSGAELELVPFYSDIIPRRPDVDSVDGVTLVNLRSMPLSNPLNSAMKRGTDIVISGLIIILFSWLYVALAIGVKASSPGPVFFEQCRIGKGNKPFEMLKFRSMRVNDESDVAWSTDEDPRKTRFGSFIRKFSLDEFPQFFNVFVGDMSIVGPRPEIPHFVEEFRDEYPRYMLRHQIRPGITGWAQVNGLRGDTPIDQRINADLWYIEHWSPWLDTKIFFMTLFGGFVNSEKLAK